jgi:N-acetyl-anhydromuramyl-L-alanine amidase AmpD
MALDIKSIAQYSLPDYVYHKEEVQKKSIFLHFTAGNSNPYLVVDGWKARADKSIKEGKSSEKVSTAFVIGGRPSKNDKHKDGEIVQAFSSKYWGNHLGLSTENFSKFGLPYKQLNNLSIGIEICNWGYLTKQADGSFKTYVNTTVDSKDVIELATQYRGYKYYHKYTDAQIASVKDLLVYLCDKYNISKKHHENMFDTNIDALSGVGGIWTHTSVREKNKYGNYDKWDCSPQPALIEMLKSL